MVRLVVASCLVLASAFPPTGLTQPQVKGTAAIVGTVVDEHQVPVPRALVQVFLAEAVRKASTNSQRLGRSSGSASTDETGGFESPVLQSAVPTSLGQIGDKRAIPPLIAALDNDDPSHRVLVIYALEALHAEEAIPRLLTLVNDDRKSRFGALVTVAEAAKAAIARLQ